MVLDNLGMLSPDSRCFSFDHRGNGFARGEGVGVLVIKLLTHALRDGDTVRAVIRSSCSNQDGKTPGLTQPSKEAQRRLILDAYRKAGLGLAETRYFEAHGTGEWRDRASYFMPSSCPGQRLAHLLLVPGHADILGIGTPLGDPVESGAIGTAFRRYRSQDEPLYV
jgi:acyl transferase domain-containing protein